jgi:hypothetical protein
MKAAPEGVTVFIRPNWKDAKAYSEGGNMILSGGIAWEFLRRNPEYQQDFESYCAEVDAFFAQNVIALFKFLEDDQPPDSFCSKAGFFEFEKTDRHDYWVRFFEQKWGMTTPLSPNENWAGECFVSPTTEPPETFELVKFGHVTGPRVLIPVDLSEPLETLLKKAEHQIRRLRDAGIKGGTVKPDTSRVLSPRVYIEHLRILDGCAAGETLQKIGEVVRPSATNAPDDKQRDKAIRAAYTAAKKMQDGGYRALTY